MLAKSRGSMERSLITTDKNTRYCKKHLIKSRLSPCGRIPTAIGIGQARKRPHSVTFPVPSLGCLHIFLGILLATHLQSIVFISCYIRIVSCLFGVRSYLTDSTVCLIFYYWIVNCYFSQSSFLLENNVPPDKPLP